MSGCSEPGLCGRTGWGGSGHLQIDGLKGGGGAFGRVLAQSSRKQTSLQVRAQLRLLTPLGGGPLPPESHLQPALCHRVVSEGLEGGVLGLKPWGAERGR